MMSLQKQSDLHESFMHHQDVPGSRSGSGSVSVSVEQEDVPLHEDCPEAADDTVSTASSGSVSRSDKEVLVALEFIVTHMAGTSELPSNYSETLLDLLVSRINNSTWNPDAPNHGSAARSVLCSKSKLDPLLLKAASVSNIPPETVKNAFGGDLRSTQEWCLWIDPGSVSYRLGSDHTPIVTLWEDPEITHKLIQKQQEALKLKYAAQHIEQTRLEEMYSNQNLSVSFSPPRHGSLTDFAPSYSAPRQNSHPNMSSKVKITMKRPSDQALWEKMSAGSSIFVSN